MDVTIICIGDELLTGDVEDLNSTWLARQLAETGALLKRIVTIPDDVDVIVSEIKQAATEKVIITGGLGPTHDDITRYAVAKAAGVSLYRDPDAVKIVEKKRGRLVEAAYVMADIPEKAAVIDNPVGTAPGFIIAGRIYVLPGVPSEMKAMFNLVRDQFKGPRLTVDWVITQRPESDIVPTLNEAVKKFPTIAFGSYPSGVVKIKMKSYDAEAVRQAKGWLTNHL
ncbi:competence/damage-inducible protein A [Methanocella sp. MCL-LM]|uniref:competence/damage-inducible protein A n=1 Tax=Methanocella sp. MCL-LM TaxID=3412035 RepID=UPI003C720A6A